MVLDSKLYPFSDPSTNEPLYDCPDDLRRRSEDSEFGSDGSWGSSEFEDDEDEEGYLAGPDIPAPTKPLPRKPCHNESADNVQVGRQTTTCTRFEEKRLRRKTRS